MHLGYVFPSGMLSPLTLPLTLATLLIARPAMVTYTLTVCLILTSSHYAMAQQATINTELQVEVLVVLVDDCLGIMHI
jgi:hypothetical protein